MNIFDKVIKTKKEPNEISESSEIQDLIEKERSRHERPFKAYSRGVIEGTGTLGDLLSLTGYPSGQVAPAEKIKAERESKLLSPEKEKEFAQSIIAEAAESDIAPPFLGTPATSRQVNEFLNMLDIPKEEIRPIEKFMGRWGRFTGATPGWPGSIGAAGTAALGGQTAEEIGFGPVGQTLAEIGVGLRFQKPSLSKIAKIDQPRIVTKKMEPGKAGAITERNLASKLDKVNDQAAEIAKDIGKKNKPFQIISEAIDKKHPIDTKFEKSFEALEDISKKANIPLKNTSSLDNFFNTELAKYEGTGAPTFMSDLIKKEIDGWMKSGKNELYPAYRRYRLNNQRVKEILSDQNFPRAFRSEAIGFFGRMNNAIASSIEASLPENSGWMKTFRGLNDIYGAYKNTQLAKKILDPLLQKTIDDKKLNSFIGNPRNWEDIERFLGPEESTKLKDVLIDMQTARTGLQSMKKIPPVWNTLMEKGVIGALTSKGFAALLSLPYATKWAIGHYFSAPEFSTNLKELSKAINNQDVSLIIRTMKKIEEENKD
jgi:hypothetical protein